MTTYEITEQLDLIASLEDNWDEEGSSSFPPSLIQKVRDIFQGVKGSNNLFISPTGRGSIQIEFKKDSDYLEFEVFEDGSVKEFYKNLFEDSQTRWIDLHTLHNSISELCKIAE